MGADDYMTKPFKQLELLAGCKEQYGGTGI